MRRSTTASCGRVPKFKDLELLGFPLTVVVGKKAEEGIVEFGIRREGGRDEIPAADAVARCQASIAELAQAT